jgi:D-glycerate 3-kinase
MDGMDENYRALAERLAARLRATTPPPRIIAIAGGQGTGKSTLARSLAQALAVAAPLARGAVLSLDDFYLPRVVRAALARSVHPLLATRGVPGTHDVARLVDALDRVFRAEPVALPVFDKGRDDRVGERFVEGPLDWVVVEGWCLGARPESDTALAAPINALERTEDPDAGFRRWVNAALAGDYQRLNARFDFLVYLLAADMDTVLRFRTEQEQAIAAEQRMDAARLARFVAHYERITRAMARDLPDRADVVVRLAPDRSYSVQGLADTVRS